LKQHVVALLCVVAGAVRRPVLVDKHRAVRAHIQLPVQPLPHRMTTKRSPWISCNNSKYM